MTGSPCVRLLMAEVTILVICGQLVSSRPPSSGLYDYSAPPPTDAEFMRRIADSLGAKRFLANMDGISYSSLADGHLLAPAAAATNHNEDLALNADVRKLLSGTRNKRHCWDVTDVCCMWSIC